MNRSQKAIVPAVMSAFWFGKIDTIFGLDGIVYAIVLVIVIGVNLAFEARGR